RGGLECSPYETYCCSARLSCARIHAWFCTLRPRPKSSRTSGYVPNNRRPWLAVRYDLQGRYPNRDCLRGSNDRRKGIMPVKLSTILWMIAAALVFAFARTTTFDVIAAIVLLGMWLTRQSLKRDEKSLQ